MIAITNTTDWQNNTPWVHTAHKRCNTTKKAFLVKVELLNVFFKVEDFDVLEECQVCSNVVDQIGGTKAPGRKRCSTVVSDAEKCFSNGLRDLGSLNVADIENIGVTCKDDNDKKHMTTMSFLTQEEGQELVMEHHSPLMH